MGADSLDKKETFFQTKRFHIVFNLVQNMNILGYVGMEIDPTYFEIFGH